MQRMPWSALCRYGKGGSLCLALLFDQVGEAVLPLSSQLVDILVLQPACSADALALRSQKSWPLDLEIGHVRENGIHVEYWTSASSVKMVLVVGHGWVLLALTVQMLEQQPDMGPD